MNAHIFFTLDPRLFLFFWGVLDVRNTVRLFKKSKRSILFDANRKNIPKKILFRGQNWPLYSIIRLWKYQKWFVLIVKGRLACTWKRSSILADAKLFDSKVMMHVIFYNTDFKRLLIRTITHVLCVRITDDVMSDDVIIDNIIAKNREMTLLVHVSPLPTLHWKLSVEFGNVVSRVNYTTMVER